MGEEDIGENVFSLRRNTGIIPKPKCADGDELTFAAWMTSNPLLNDEQMNNNNQLNTLKWFSFFQRDDFEVLCHFFWGYTLCRSLWDLQSKHDSMENGMSNFNKASFIFCPCLAQTPDFSFSVGAL